METVNVGGFKMPARKQNHPVKPLRISVYNPPKPETGKRQRVYSNNIRIN